MMKTRQQTTSGEYLRDYYRLIIFFNIVDPGLDSLTILMGLFESRSYRNINFSVTLC